MKLLLIGFLAVQIAAVICTNRRHGSTSRNPASFLLRKVCVEVAGMKEKVVGLEEKVAGLEDENEALKEKVTGLEEKVAGLEDENAALKEKVTGLEEKVAGVEDGNAALKLPGNPYFFVIFFIFHLTQVYTIQIYN